MSASSRWASRLRVLAFVPALALGQAKKAESAPAAKPADPNQAGEMLEVEKVKEKYWAQGQDSKMGVVQNRLFSKEHKFAVGILGGGTLSDPFLKVANYGGSLGYHFSEFLGVEAWYWKNAVGASSALKAARKVNNVDVSVPDPKWSTGVSALGSIMYGKLSLLGMRIIYYDMHLSGGLGASSTQYQDAIFAWNVGIGQRFYITQSLSLRGDYRLVSYQEKVYEEIVNATSGEYKGKRTNVSHTINFGLDYMFGL